MKRCFKFTLILIATMLFFGFVCNTYSFASDEWKTRVNNMITTADAQKGEAAVTSTQNVVGAIITITRSIATGVAIIMLIVLAMKYMMAAPGDRADIKKHAVVYIVGAVVLFAASGILGIIAKFAAEI